MTGRRLWPGVAGTVLTASAALLGLLVSASVAGADFSSTAAGTTTVSVPAGATSATVIVSGAKGADSLLPSGIPRRCRDTSHRNDPS